MGRHDAATTNKVLHGARGYDVLVWVLTLGRERRFRERIVQLARLGSGDSVLDVGCGTGTLAIAAKARAGSGGEVCGVDPSPEMVTRARRKAVKAGVEVRIETATAEGLPFLDGTFDLVLSTLMLHHLSEEGRQQAIQEIARVLRPGGRFLAVDIGGAPKGKRRGFLHRLPNHAHFDLDEVTPMLDGVGFRIVDRGPVGSPGVVGLSNLQFVLAAAP